MIQQAIDPNKPAPYEFADTPPRESKPKGILLHCGADVVDRRDLYQIQTPAATRTWYPLPHTQLLDQIESQLWVQSFQIKSETHSLSHDGARYFGVLEIHRPDHNGRDYSWLVGIRNSHDKSIPAGIVAGTRVFVCDNLAFSGEVKIQRKHTRFAARDLRDMIQGAIGNLGGQLTQVDRKIGVLKEFKVRENAAHDLVVRAVDDGAITITQVPEVLKHWRDPEHQTFAPRNAWSLFNAFTEVTKTLPPAIQVERGEALQQLFDRRFKLVA